MIRVKLLSKVNNREWQARLPKERMREQNIEFVFDADARDYDWLLVYDDLPTANGERHSQRIEPLSCAQENTVLITTEPSSIKIYGDCYTRQFATVITSQEPWALQHPHRIYSQASTRWFYGVGENSVKTLEDIEKNPPIDKTHQLSVVWSAKKQKHTAHEQRYHFLKHCKQSLQELDIYGSDHIALNDKAEALDQYRYHIAVENHFSKHHFTEKLADSYLGLCLPFYYGCPNYTDYFPQESLIPIDIQKPDEAIRIIKLAIQNNEYEKRLDAIKEARRILLEQYGLFDVLASMIQKQPELSTTILQDNKILSRRLANRQSIQCRLQYSKRKIQFRMDSWLRKKFS